MLEARSCGWAPRVHRATKTEIMSSAANLVSPRRWGGCTRPSTGCFLAPAPTDAHAPAGGQHRRKKSICSCSDASDWTQKGDKAGTQAKEPPPTETSLHLLAWIYFSFSIISHLLLVLSPRQYFYRDARIDFHFCIPAHHL